MYATVHDCFFITKHFSHTANLRAVAYIHISPRRASASDAQGQISEEEYMGHVLSTARQTFVQNSGKTVLFSSFKILECRVYQGPHLYSHTPMIRLQVDLGELEAWPTNTIPNFTRKLIEKLPGLYQHTCSTGHIGGFVARLNEGTWLGHVIEHVAIELQLMAGLKVARGKTRSVKGKPGHYNIMYSYEFEDAGLYAGRLAAELVSSLLEAPLSAFEGLDKIYRSYSENFDLEAGIIKLKELADREKLGPTTASIVEEAERRNIPWMRLDDASLIQLGTGCHRKLIRASITSSTACMAVDLAANKNLTKKLLMQAGIPVPQGDVVRTMEGAVEVAEETGFPVTVKPLDGNHGRGVITNLNNAAQVAEAFTRAQAHSPDVIVENHYNGRDYRVLIVKGDVIAVAERVPAHVIGNGRDTISQLIDIVNSDPRRGIGHKEVMTRIAKDETLIAWLARSGLTLESIPEKMQHVILSPTANMSTGGSAIDRTDDIHPDNALIASRAALTIGLDIAGIDMVLPDISRSWRETGGGIVEVNASPGFRMHLQPSEGRPRDVAKAVVSSLFPAGEKTQVPVIAVTGTNGKSTTVRMVAHILRQSGLRVGFTSTSGVFINDECIWEGDASGPRSARMLLRDPSIDVAVIETARGGILREGLGVMECDVGAVLNVTSDHLGIGGIDTLEDLAAVKSVVTESVIDHGVSVLNADDSLTASMARYAGGSVFYFSMSNGKTGLMAKHIEQGGRGITREIIGGKAQLVMHEDGMRTPVIGVDEIPATHFGAASFNIENALAAIAIASGLGIDVQTIRMALGSFTSSFEQNPGRFNIYDGHGFRVIMDYAHNPAALKAFFKVVSDMRGHYLHVLGNISIPGDRRDDDIREAGSIACRELDLAVFSDLPDNRGRAKGEIQQLLIQGAKMAQCNVDHILCTSLESEAMQLCLERARPGDLVILMSGDPHAAWKQMQAFKPKFNDPTKPNMVMEHQAHA
jgi:cyanophycin synthetase